MKRRREKIRHDETAKSHLDIQILTLSVNKVKIASNNSRKNHLESLSTPSPLPFQSLLRSFCVVEGEGRESSALALSPRGAGSPWIPAFLGLWGAEFWFLPRWYSPQGRSPAYPLFRKEKVGRRAWQEDESLYRLGPHPFFLP